jgi:hypothetical protein
MEDLRWFLKCTFIGMLVLSVMIAIIIALIFATKNMLIILGIIGFILLSFMIGYFLTDNEDFQESDMYD